MNRPGVELLQEMSRGPQRKPALTLLLSTALIAGWWVIAAHSTHGAAAERSVADDDLGQFAWDVWPAFGSAIVLLGLVPALAVRLVFQEPVSHYGCRLGNWRDGLWLTMLFIPVCVGLGYWSAQQREFQAIYPQDASARAWLVAYLLMQLGYYAAWEFHFRGFLLGGLYYVAGLPVAMGMQIMASTLAHFGKPPGEIFAAIGGGPLFGILAVRTRSIWYGVILHFVLGAALDWFILFA